MSDLHSDVLALVSRGSQEDVVFLEAFLAMFAPERGVNPRALARRNPIDTLPGQVSDLDDAGAGPREAGSAGATPVKTSAQSTDKTSLAVEPALGRWRCCSGPNPLRTRSLISTKNPMDGERSDPPDHVSKSRAISGRVSRPWGRPVWS